MEDMQGVMNTVLQKLRNPKQNTEPSSVEYMRRTIDRYNSTAGKLTGYDCPKCKNRGNFMFLADGQYETIRECECMKIRRTLQRIEQSGLKDLIKIYTFDKFIAASPWQTQMKRLGEEFAAGTGGDWFYAGGQVGSGKTHICTAIAAELINAGKEVVYMLWRDEIVPLKSNVNDADAYDRAIRRFKKAEVLYIDDFFKTERGKQPTAADVNIAFEILNYRYINSGLITIISSELRVDDIIDIDEAVGSRIYQRSRRYCVIIPTDEMKNYRLHGAA